MKLLVWVGVGLNITATLINVFEKTNSSISKNLMKDIQAIKEGSYVDESSIELPAAGSATKDEKTVPLLTS